MDVLLTLLHVSQASLSAYTLYLSYLIIPKLQQYEEKSEKAAEYSNTAEHQLHKTRTTQASGVLATTFSLCTAVSLAVFAKQLPPWAKCLLSVANFGTAIFAYTHISDFWRGKAKVPFINDFNDAITLTDQMATYLACLSGSWAIGALLLFGGVMQSLGGFGSGSSHGEL